MIQPLRLAQTPLNQSDLSIVNLITNAVEQSSQRHLPIKVGLNEGSEKLELFIINDKNGAGKTLSDWGANHFTANGKTFITLQNTATGGFLYGLAVRKSLGDKPPGPQIIPHGASNHFIDGVKKASQHNEPLNLQSIINAGSTELSRAIGDSSDIQISQKEKANDLVDPREFRKIKPDINQNNPTNPKSIPDENPLKNKTIYTYPRVKIIESVGRGTEVVTSYKDLERHHPSTPPNDPKRTYKFLNGRFEEVNRFNHHLVNKDFILVGAKNRQRGVPVPSPVSGYVQKIPSDGGYNIYADKERKNLIATVLHMEGLKLNTGDFVEYGQALGGQSGVGPQGRTQYGVHVHMSATPETYERYIQDLLDGVFDGKPNSKIGKN